MERRTKLVAGGAAAVAVAVLAATAGMALAAGGDGNKPLTGSTMDKAVAAALEETGDGTVTETEVGDDGAAYSVEIQLDDGSPVEVNLDRDINVVGQEADDDGPGDTDGPGDD
jgi:uncharacterized membrane protein YkoI